MPGSTTRTVHPGHPLTGGPPSIQEDVNCAHHISVKLGGKAKGEALRVSPIFGCLECVLRGRCVAWKYQPSSPHASPKTPTFRNLGQRVRLPQGEVGTPEHLACICL